MTGSKEKTRESGKGSKIVSGPPEPLDTDQNPEAPRDITCSSHKQGNEQHKARPTKLGEKAISSKTPANTENDSIIGLDALKIVIDSKEEDLTPLGETTERQRVAERRNRNRVKKVKASYQKLISKYLPMTVDEILPNKIPGPGYAFKPPAWLIEAIESFAKAEAPVPKAPPVRFDLSEEAVLFNTCLLKDSNLNLQHLLSQHQDTTLGFGTEFCPLDQLEAILGENPNFGFFAKVLASGMNYRFTQELSDNKRRAKVSTMLEQGNHKSVQEDGEEVQKLLSKDVLNGFSLPVSPEIVPNIKQAMVQPAGVVRQFSLWEDEARVQKR
jgi:hypothetical protein